MSWWGWEGERVRGWEGERVRGWEGERGYNTFHTTSAALRLIALVTQTTPSASPVVVSVKYWKREETGMRGEERTEKERKERKRGKDQVKKKCSYFGWSPSLMSLSALLLSAKAWCSSILFSASPFLIVWWISILIDFNPSLLPSSFKYLVDSCHIIKKADVPYFWSLYPYSCMYHSDPLWW